MKQSVKNMTQGSPPRLIMEFAMPVLISQLFQQLYNTVDSLIVGRFLGTEELAAVSSSGNLIFLFTSFFIGTSMGAGVVIARYYGAGEEERVSKAIHTTVFLGILSGILLSVLGVSISPLILQWMDTDPEVMGQAVEYFRYYFMGIWAQILFNHGKDIMGALGDSRRPLYYLMISSVFNIILDLILIGGLRCGVWAAALATVFSQILSMTLCMIHLMRMESAYRLEWKKLRPDSRILKEIIRIGFPSGIQNSVIGIANVIVQTNINSFGKIATAAYGSYAKIEGFAFLPVTSFTMALTTFTGQNLGARNYERAKKGSRFGILAAVFLAEGIGVIIYTAAPWLIGLFSDQQQVIEMGIRQARIEALFYAFLAFSHSIAAVCRGAGKAFVPMTIMLMIWCVFRICYISVVMRQFHQIQFIYWAYPLTWGMSSAVYLFYYHFCDWLHGFERKK